MEAMGSPVKLRKGITKGKEELQTMDFTLMTPSTRKSDEQSVSSYDGNVVKSQCDVPEEILKRLENAKSKARSPISEFKVGCLIETTDGHFHEGFNVEFNDTRHSTIHAEQAAISQALLNNQTVKKLWCTYLPCGLCRQFILETCGQ